MRKLLVPCLAFMTLSALWPFLPTLQACPICPAAGRTLTEELASMDVAVIARLEDGSPLANEPSGDVTKATFEITEVLKGASVLKVGDEVSALYFGNGKPGGSFLLMGIEPPKIQWSTPLSLSERADVYMHEILKLPKEGPQRLIFLQRYLEDEDDLLARDAYDEFAGAEYEHVRGMKDHMDRDQLVAWINDPNIPASRRRVYLMMLGVCGGKKDMKMLEGFMRSSDRKKKAGLDALIACYLTLKGPKGLELVDELYLANKKADYTDTYSAIMALRFHGTEEDVIDKQYLVRSLRHVLERPELADLVMPDLARFEDWGPMDRMMDLYRHEDRQNQWLRVPVVNYLRACPLPRAKALLSECERLDPAAAQRAHSFNTYMPVAAAPNTQQPSATPSKSPLQAGAPTFAPARKPKLWVILGVPWAAGLALMVVQWALLRGRR